MPDIKTLIEGKTSYITRCLSDLKRYISEELDEKDTMKFLIDLESEILNEFSVIKTFLGFLLMFNVAVLLLLIFKG